MKTEDRNVTYLAILTERSAFGHQKVHAGLARHGIGRTMCSDKQLFEFPLTARDPNFALYRPNGWRHRYAEAFLELNRGCRDCLHILHTIGDEAGWTKPKSLEALK
ncbi:MAG TPA: hypothetical protein VFI54_06295 [Solirubrobacteraceae bacterium]|nr:hypothetical protein [Solirubrobacteraceae bacterium]